MNGPTLREVAEATARIGCIRMFWGAQRPCAEYTDRELCASCMAKKALEAPVADEHTKVVTILSDYNISPWGEVLCASCKHPHSEGAWSDRDPDDGTCWNAGSLVCGCPKFITPSVQKMRLERAKRNRL